MPHANTVRSLVTSDTSASHAGHLSKGNAVSNVVGIGILPVFGVNMCSL
jgi:hypothetical protein